MLDEEILRMLKLRESVLAALPPVNEESEARIDEIFRKQLPENPKIIKLTRKVTT